MGFEILVWLVLADSRNLGKGNKIQLDKRDNEYGLLLFSCSVVSNSLWPRGLHHIILPSFTISRSLLKLTSIELMMPSSHLTLCCPLLLLPSILPSIRVFSNESAPHIRWPNCWSFNFNISPSNEYSGLISFRNDWFDFVLQRTLMSLLQHQKHQF